MTRPNNERERFLNRRTSVDLDLQVGCSDVNVPFADLPRDYFGAILVDAPVRFATWSPKGMGRSPDRHYPTMSWDELRELNVGALAKPDSVLFVWVCWHSLPKYLELIERWGFTYKTCAFDWTKADVGQFYMFGEDDVDVAIGCGYWTRQNTEPCLLATRGHPKRRNADVPQAIIAPRREHSRKPDEIHGRIERLVAGPYCELFARRERNGWKTWGNEIPSRPTASAPEDRSSERTAPEQQPDDTLSIPAFLRRAS